MGNDRLSERSLIIVTAIVWTALAASGIVAVIKTGVAGIVFLFIIFMVAVPAWAHVVREREKGVSSTELEKRLAELSSKISELSAKIDELKKAMEE